MTWEPSILGKHEQLVNHGTTWVMFHSYATLQKGTWQNTCLVFHNCTPPSCEKRRVLLTTEHRWMRSCSVTKWPKFFWLQRDEGHPLVNQHNYGKSPFLMGKSTINGPCSIAFWCFLYVYQRVSGRNQFPLTTLLVIKHSNRKSTKNGGF